MGACLESSQRTKIMEDNKNGEDMLMRQTSSDVKLFKKADARASAPNDDDDELRDIDPEVANQFYGDYYDMSGDKHMIILNQNEFKSTPYFNYQRFSPRRGTYRDVESLQKTFGELLGFKVKTYNDLDYDDIMDAVSNLCNAEHKSTSCVAVAILTHGERGGEVCAADRPYAVTDIMNLLQRTPGLAGKPKLLFVQACRGQKVDEGQRIQLDGDEVSIVIPTHADSFVLYSSYEDHLSYRDMHGSWMIQALCSVVSETHGTLELLQMVTLVLRHVALRFTNIPTNKQMHNKKQMPEARFTLTKFLKFPSIS